MFTEKMVIDLLIEERELASTNRYFTGELTRSDIAKKLKCSYSVAHKLCALLEKKGRVKVRWTHAHHTYWEGYFSIV